MYISAWEYYSAAPEIWEEENSGAKNNHFRYERVRRTSAGKVFFFSFISFFFSSLSFSYFALFYFFIIIIIYIYIYIYINCLFKIERILGERPKKRLFSEVNG